VVSVTQAGAGIIAAFNMFDPPSQVGVTSACRVRGPSSTWLTTCPLTNTSRTTGANTLVSYSWTVQYTYNGAPKTFTQNTTIADFAVTEFCGFAGSAPGGANIPMTVSMTATDSNGVTATATSGTGTQPALQLVAYACGT
jgi:hypothetical protein